MTYLLIAWMVFNGELIVDQGQMKTAEQCEEVGANWIAQGDFGEFRCILQQDL